MDQNPISDAREREAVGLIHPSSNGTGMAIQLTREGLKVRVIGEKSFYAVGHCCTVASFEGQCRLIYARH